MVHIVTPGYLGAMGMHLLEGRDFNWQDATRSEPVVIINQAAARRFWPGEDPVGRMALGEWPRHSVSAWSPMSGKPAWKRATGPEMYLPVRRPDPEGAELVVRTKLPPEALAASVMRTLRALNPGPARIGISPAPANRGSRRFAAPLLRDAGRELRAARAQSWRRSEFTASSPIRSRGRRRRSASAWRLALRRFKYNLA